MGALVIPGATPLPAMLHRGALVERAMLHRYDRTIDAYQHYRTLAADGWSWPETLTVRLQDVPDHCEEEAGAAAIKLVEAVVALQVMGFPVRRMFVDGVLEVTYEGVSDAEGR